MRSSGWLVLLSMLAFLAAAACGSEVTISGGPDDDDDGVAGTGGTPPGTPTGTGGTPPGTPTGTGGTPPGTPTGTGGTPPGTPTGTGGTPAGTPTGTGGCPNPVCGTCEVGFLGAAVPQVVTGSTVGLGNDFEPSCAAGGSSDMSFVFTAPTSGQYVADTVGSSFDTVLHVYDTFVCVERACDDDGGGGLQSRVSGWIDGGEEVLIVVDGYGGDAGNFVLHIHQGPPPPCPDEDLGSTYPQFVPGFTSGSSHYGGTCGGGQAPEVSYAFTAPVSGTYHFSTVGSSYDTLLYVRANSCTGPELGCDDDGAGNLQSWVPLSLTAGQTVIIFVDGFADSQGQYLLRIYGP